MEIPRPIWSWPLCYWAVATLPLFVFFKCSSSFISPGCVIWGFLLLEMFPAISLRDSLFPYMYSTQKPSLSTLILLYHHHCPPLPHPQQADPCRHTVTFIIFTALVTIWIIWFVNFLIVSLLQTKQRHYFANKGLSSQGYGFSCGHVWMWELDCEEGWAPKNWCFWTVVLEKTLESPLDCKKIQPVHSEGDQPWNFFGRNDAEAETPVLWPPHAKSWLIGKDSDAGRDWGQEEKGTQRMRWLAGITDSMDVSLSELQ